MRPSHDTTPPADPSELATAAPDPGGLLEQVLVDASAHAAAHPSLSLRTVVPAADRLARAAARARRTGRLDHLADHPALLDQLLVHAVLSRRAALAQAARAVLQELVEHAGPGVLDALPAAHLALLCPEVLAQACRQRFGSTGSAAALADTLCRDPFHGTFAELCDLVARLDDTGPSVR